MKFSSLIFMSFAFVAYVSAQEGETTTYYCVGNDQSGQCMIHGFETTPCPSFGMLLNCLGGYSRRCGGCQSKTAEGDVIYGDAMNKWCSDKGGMVVTVSKLRACNL
ncbi:hypothetical protein INT47_011305 [Mucor saturninus]|uniref:Uncharacterized protein n=1 Tax=Mucor saturninus TaxID=64648 RepID=A0A8H7V7M6_9FUNG|nr:hypothetical protein INT47_011305 [Mucor saturninus]